MISVRDLSKRFNGKPILDGVSIDIRQGEVVAIMGSSGTGKSVFLQHLIGLMKPDAGTVEINGHNIIHLKERQLLKVRRNIGYVFQEGALYDFMTVFDNLAFVLREHTSMKFSEIRDKVQSVLKLVDLKDADEKFPSELSGGMRKRVGLARAIVMDTKVLLCDEPTSGLDPIRSRDISDLIKRVTERIHCATVFTSHDVANSCRIANRLAILNEGRFVEMGSCEEVHRSANPFVREFMGLN